MDVWTDAVAILIASLVIAAFTVAIIIFRPAARRRRRHKRHARQPKIDLMRHEPGESKLSPDA
jgi:flagellar biosynthesis/type III secretory pathway M-ring protein FliF/YscJ